MRTDAQIQHDVDEPLKWEPRVSETDIGDRRQGWDRRTQRECAHVRG